MSAFRTDRAGSPVAIRVNGELVHARRHDTVAAALIAAGRWTTRRTRRGQPRGPFCLIGMCQECVAEIDHCPGVRTCLTLVAAGMQVRLDV